MASGGSTSLPSVCVIGAGSSGIAAAKALHERGISFDCFEKSDRVGGNWVFEQHATGCPRRTARCTSTPRASGWSTRTSRCRSPIRTSRTTRTSPQYFDDYVDHFGFRDRIRSRPVSSTPSAAPTASGASRSTTARRARYDALLVANGHHWDPRWPEPAFPGRTLRRRADALAPLRATTRAASATSACVVLGMGNSAMDIAVEATLRRRARVPGRAPRRVRDPQVPASAGRSTRSASTHHAGSRRASGGRSSQGLLRLGVGDMERYGLPKPDHRLRRGAPDDLRTTSSTASAHGDDHAEAEHRAARRRRRSRSPTAPRSRPTSSSTAPATRSRSRSSTRTSSRRPTTTCRCSGACSTRRSPNVVLHRAAAAARRDHAARRGAGGVGRDYLAGGYRCPPGPTMRADIERERGRDVQALRGLQAPHDAGRLRRLPAATSARSARPAPSGPAAAGFALPVPAARASAAEAAWRRDATRSRQARADEGGQPRGDPRRGARGVRRARLRRGQRARHRAPHRARLGHVLQLLPRQGVGLPRARGGGRARGAPARPRRAPRAATPRGVRRRRLPRVLRLHRRGPRRCSR